MNTVKAQREVFNALIKGSPAKTAVDEHRTFVTLDGYRGFVFNNSEICFNAERIADMPQLDCFDCVKDENLLTRTNILVENPSGGRSYILRCFTRPEGTKVYARDSWFDIFENYKVYCRAPISPLVIVEQIGRGEACISGVVMPTRCKDE